MVFKIPVSEKELITDGKEFNKESLGVTTTKEVEPMIPKVIAKLKPETGLYLVKPHGKMISIGEKTLIVKSKKFTAHIKEPLYLLEDNLCYGIIELEEPKEITPEEFEKLRDKHKITDKEAFEQWSWKKGNNLFAYDFNILERYEPPQPVQIPQGVQVFVSAKLLRWKELKSMTMLELFEYNDKDLPESMKINLYEEMIERNIQVLIKGWIEDYDAKEPNDKQLGDDFRIVLAWYSSIKRGKTLYKKVGEERKEITLENCKELGLKIFKEMIIRGFSFNKPEEYKEQARELFEWLITQVGKDKVPFKEKKEEKAFPKPSEIQREHLEQIDNLYVETLTDEQLLALHTRLHELEKETGKVTEPLENAHIFVWKEIRKRKLKHTIESPLDHATSLEVIEYPLPEEGVPQELSEEEKIKLIQVLKAFPEKILVEDPIHVYLCGRIVNLKEIPESHDLDLLFKQGWYHVPTVKAFLNEVSKSDPEVAKRFHFVWDSLGPQIGYTVPLYRLAFIKVPDEEMNRTSPFEFLSNLAPQIFKPFIGMKPKSGFKKFEFWDPEELWEKWAKEYIDRGIIVQKKYDGMKFQIHCKGNQIKIITEDRKRDRVEAFKKSVEELLKEKKADSFIIDAEMVEYNCGKIQTSNYEEVCEPIEREQMIKWIGAGVEKLDDQFIVFHVHDCVYLNGEPLQDKGYTERWAAIDKIFGDKLVHWRKVPGEKAEDMRRFLSLVKKYRSLRGSEGVVCKAQDSIYKIKFSGESRTEEWAKLKNLKEIDVMVWKVIQKKTKAGKLLSQWLYESIFSVPCSDIGKYREKDVIKKDGKCYLWIGRTYATGERVKPGEIIIVRPIRIAEFKDPQDKLYYTWMFPYFEGKHPVKKEPDSIDVVKKLVAIGTGPSPKELSNFVYKLPSCPFWNDERICILKERFQVPRDELSKTVVEHLKFPIVCKFANHYKCRFVKNYYYGLKEIESEKEVDEDTGEELNEDQS